MDWSDFGGIVQSDVGQGKVAAALNAHRSARVEAGNARKLPSRRNPARSKQAIKRKIPVVAHCEVMSQVERRRAVGTRRIEWIPLGRYVIQGLGVGIAEQEGQVASATLGR